MFDFDWRFPYPSQRMPVMGRDVVATSQPLAAEAGLDMLRRGGNAVDAAIATAITLTVVEPTSNGIGSDAFALFWKDGRLHGLNASGRSPRALPTETFLGLEEMPLVGWDPVTTPGAVSGWVMLSERHGTLPFEQLFEHAIRHAEEGFPVSPQTASSWRGAARRWGELEGFAQTFLPGGRGPATGEVRTLKDHGATLRAIAESRGEAFYRGELAARMAANAEEMGGYLALEDLESHAAFEVEPLSIDYRGWTLHELPPNGQGIAALIMLGILRHFDVGDLSPDGADLLHLQIEAMKLAFRDVRRYVADPDFMELPPAAMLDAEYLEARSAMIDPERAQDFDHGDPKAGGTILLCTADRAGNMVSFIQSNYTGFGSGIVVPGTGISLQNRGGCFVTKEGHPNQVAPGKRPYHTIIPAFVTKDGQPVCAFGVMGGPMQPQGHAQVLARMADWGQNPQAAMDASRWQVTSGLEVMIEPGYPDATYEGLEARGHRLRRASRRSVTYGGGQAIVKQANGTYVAASDLRRDGQAVAR